MAARAGSGRTVVAFAAVAAILALVGAGCGGGGAESPATAAGGPPKGELTVASWPGTVAVGPHGTVAGFEGQTGVKVDYRPEVEDDERLLEELEPALENGESGGRDILVVSDWMAKLMHERGYLQELNHEDLPTVFKHMQPRLLKVDFDPGRRFSIPMSTNLIGIWINTRRAHFSSLVEFFDPGIAGEAAMSSELRESAPLVMQAEGEQPDKASTAEWLAAIRRIRLAAQVGQLAGLFGSEDAEGLNSGKLIAAVGRSTDAPLIHNPNVEWLVPDQGCVLSSVDMVIPVGAPNTAAALAWMNYLYRPAVAADITEHVNRISPVKGVKEVLEKRDGKRAGERPVFPRGKISRHCSDQASPPDLERVNEAWQEALEAGR